MILEASALLNAQIKTTQDEKLGNVDRLIFSSATAKLVVIQVVSTKVLKKFTALDYDDVISAERGLVVVDSANSLTKDLKPLDEEYKKTGRVIGVNAVTKSGQSTGKVVDVAFDETTGLITRFYLRQLLTERIIPRSFLVQITPKKIIFEDAINSPTFDRLASQQSY